MKRQFLNSFFCLIIFYNLFYSQKNKNEDAFHSGRIEVIDRLSIPGPINFRDQEFFLSWSKQNSPTWAQQKYSLRDDDLDHFKEIINISYFDKEIDIETAVKQKVEYIEKRKQDTNDKYSYIHVTESPDGKEIIVDYLVTIVPSEGEPFAEYNLDRFKTINIEGKKSFVIFSYSKRIEGDLKYASRALSKERDRIMEAIIKMSIPPITYKATDVESKK